MKISELKAIINAIDPCYDDLNVWIDTDCDEGGRPVKSSHIQLAYAEDCSLDGDDVGDETLYEDEVLELLGVDTLPQVDTVEWTAVLMKMGEMNYRWEGQSYGEHRFSKKILALKF